MLVIKGLIYIQLTGEQYVLVCRQSGRSEYRGKQQKTEEQYRPRTQSDQQCQV